MAGYITPVQPLTVGSADFIKPIQPLTIGEDGLTTKGTSSVLETTGSTFKNILAEAVGNAVTAERDLENKEYLLATGQIDDAHTVPIASAEAQLSIDLLVSLRNKAVEAYNGLMNISL